MIATDLNPALKPVAFLLGTWRGEGEGQYPSIKPFRYREEIRFTQQRQGIPHLRPADRGHRYRLADARRGRIPAAGR